MHEGMSIMAFRMVMNLKKLTTSIFKQAEKI